MCEVVVLCLWTMSLFLRQGGPGACGEDNWVGDIQLGCLGPVGLVTEPWGVRCGAFIQVSLCIELQQSPGSYASVVTLGFRISR